MDYKVVKTAMSMHLANHRDFGIPYTILDNTSINQRFGIANGVQPKPNEHPVVKYLALGRRGILFGSKSDGLADNKWNPHDTRDNGLYDFVPFVVREAKNDLSANERAKYRMRVPFVGKDGVQYVAYFLKAIDLSGAVPVLHQRFVKDGVQQTKVYEPVPESLTPKPRDLANFNVLNPTGDCIIATVPLEIVLTPSECAEMHRAVKLMYDLSDDDTGLYVTEVGLVTGVDRVIKGANGGVGMEYTEAIGAQMYAYATDVYYIGESPTTLKMKFSVGNNQMTLTQI